MANVITYLSFFSIFLIVLSFIFLKRDNLNKYLQDESKNRIYCIIGVFLLISEIQWFITTIIYGATMSSEKYWSLLRGEICVFISPILAYVFLTKNEKLMKYFVPWVFIGGMVPIFSPPWKYSGNAFEVYFDIKGLIDHLIYIFIGIISMFIMKVNVKEDFLLSIKGISIFIGWQIIFVGIPYWVTNIQDIGKYSTLLLKPSVVGDGNFAIFETIGIPHPWPFFIMLVLTIGIVYLWYLTADKLHKKFWEKNFKKEVNSL